MLFFNSRLNDTQIYIAAIADQVGDHVVLIAQFIKQKISDHYKHLSLQENQHK